METAREICAGARSGTADAMVLAAACTGFGAKGCISALRVVHFRGLSPLKNVLIDPAKKLFLFSGLRDAKLTKIPVFNGL